MQIIRYAACVAFGVAAFCGSVRAQDVMPETLPGKPAAEKIVRETAPLSGVEQTLAVEAPAAPSAANAAFGESVVRTALQYLGARYSRGSMGPYAFDCSGFTSFVYRQENVPILRDSRSQFSQGTPVARIADLRKGDLVFFGGSRGSRTVGHVGIVTDVSPDGGAFSFVHASSSGGVKVSDSSESYYSRRYIGARRIVEE